MESIYNHKEKIQAPNLNDALEHMLTSLFAMVAETEDQIIKYKEQSDKQNAIVEQAKRVSDAYRRREWTYSSEDVIVWIDKSRKLALLIDPTKPIITKPLP